MAVRSCRLGSGGRGEACGVPRSPSELRVSGLRGPRSRAGGEVLVAGCTVSVDKADGEGSVPCHRVCAGCCRAFGCYRVGTCVACLAPWGSGRILDILLAVDHETRYIYERRCRNMHLYGARRRCAASSGYKNLGVRRKGHASSVLSPNSWTDTSCSASKSTRTDFPRRSLAS